MPRQTGGGGVGIIPSELFGVSRLAENLRGLKEQIDVKDQKKKDEERQEEQDRIAEEQRVLQNRLAVEQADRLQGESEQRTQRFNEITVQNTATEDAFKALGFTGSAEVGAQLQSGELDLRELQRRLVEAQTTTEESRPDLIAAQVQNFADENAFRDRQLDATISKAAIDDPAHAMRVEEAIEISKRIGVSRDMVLRGIQQPGMNLLLDEVIQDGRNMIAEEATLELETARQNTDLERMRTLVSIINTKGLEGSEAAARVAEASLQELLEQSFPGLATFSTERRGIIPFFKSDVTELSINTELLVTPSVQAAQLLLQEVLDSVEPLDEGIAEKAGITVVEARDAGASDEDIRSAAMAVINNPSAPDANKQLARGQILQLEITGTVDVEDEGELGEQVGSENTEFASFNDRELLSALDRAVTEIDSMDLAKTPEERRKVIEATRRRREIRKEQIRRRQNR